MFPKVSKLSWADHINHICSKARKLVGMLYRQFYTWADTSTLLRIYLTCIRPHLEYACQLWDPYTDKGTQALESVQKFACKVCLKRWDMDYESMLQQLELTSLSRRNFLKLTTMYNIINGTLYFPAGYFVQNYFPYSSSHGTLNYIRPFARTICIHHLSHPLSLCGITYQIVLKLLLSLYLRLTYHISKHCYLCSLCPFST